jgi:hypothetical protein
VWTDHDPLTVEGATPQANRSRTGADLAPIVVMWLRLELKRRWRTLVVLGVLVVLGTGTVLTSIAGARRGASAVDRLMTVTLPGTAVVIPNQPHFDWERIETLPEVEALTTFPAYLSLTVLETSNDAITPLVPADTNAMRTIERPVLLAGRLADPTRPRRGGRHAGLCEQRRQ